MKLTEGKSSLARLMAQEQIIVEQRSNVNTAFFDTEKRLLVVPEFKDDVSVNVLDLMLSHEVGHSLETPHDGWVYAIKELKINKSILNTCEDARIESFIKNKYPGLKKNYHFGYTELYNNDFFGTSSLDLENLNLIDKINLHFKVGFLQFISFSEEEQKFVSAVESAETFDDVIKVSQEIQDYLKEKLKEEFENLESATLNDFEFGDGEEGGEGFEIEFPYNGLNSKSSDENESYSDELDRALQEYIEDNLKSHTQEASEINQRELYKNDGKESIYVDIPNIKLEDMIADHKMIYARLEAEVQKQYIDTTAYTKFKAENSSVISYLVKEFNLKKNAEGRKKVKISKTGDINLNKLYSYKISEDIFKRSAITPKAQSHGLVFFLDWSGSMVCYLEDTIKQLMVLLSFCRKVNIPFEVYAFTTSYGSNYQHKPNELILNPLTLMNLFSSRMTNNEFIKASNYLLSHTGNRFVNKSTQEKDQYGYYYGGYIPHWFQLGNTPLNHSIIYSKQVMEEFKQRTKVQICNAIYLTDGESHGLEFAVIAKNYNDQDYLREITLTNRLYNVYVRDKKSKEVFKYKSLGGMFNETNQCVKLIKNISDFKMFAFRLIKQSEMKRDYYKFCTDRSVPDVKEFSKNNCLEVKTNFDKFYFVKTNSMKAEIELGDMEGKTTANIAKEFSKVMGNKVNSKVFLKKFIQFIS